MLSPRIGRIDLGHATKPGATDASFTEEIPRKEEVLENGKKVVKTVKDKMVHELTAREQQDRRQSRSSASPKRPALVQHLQSRFSGVYAFRNPSDKEQSVEFKLQFPTTQAIYDNLTFNVDGNPVR